VPEALARCEQLVVSARGDRLFEAVATWGVAALLAMAGRADEAREQIVRRLSVFDATGRMRAIRVYRILVAEAMELVGDLDQAEQQLRVKWQLFRDERQWVPDARAMHAAYHLGQLYCDQGRWEEAERCLEYGRSVPTPDYFRHESVIRLAVAARVEAQRGNSAESIRLAHRATSLADLSDFLNLRARTWLARAEVEERGGRAVEARAAREAAANIYQAKGNTLALRRVALR
jgi:tetratricopeptide (TPR) repeat protein